MKFFLAVLALLLVAASATTISQQWYTDSACSQGEVIAQVQSGQCYLDSADYSGMQWNCAGGSVVAFVYNYGDENCTGSPIGKKVFAPNQCIGPVYNNLYLIASGC